MTLRHKQLAPTADVLESIYGWLQTVRDHTDQCQDQHAARALHELSDCVMCLADLVDRHITAPDVEARVDGRG